MMSRPHQTFDSEYYRRYYETPRTAVVTAGQAKREVAFVVSFCRHIGVKIERFSDIGAGTGWWAREFRKVSPKSSIETFDASADAARLYGHRHARAETIGGRQSDLVICRDVLRYLPDAAARIAITRLAAKCRGVLYLHVVTRDDEIDEDASDMSGYFRSARWYLRELERARFTNAGMGLFVSHRCKSFDPFAIEVV
jgi:hypothetical protein